MDARKKRSRLRHPCLLLAGTCGAASASTVAATIRSGGVGINLLVPALRAGSWASSSMILPTSGDRCNRTRTLALRGRPSEPLCATTAPSVSSRKRTGHGIPGAQAQPRPDPRCLLPDHHRRRQVWPAPFLHAMGGQPGAPPGSVDARGSSSQLTTDDVIRRTNCFCNDLNRGNADSIDWDPCRVWNPCAPPRPGPGRRQGRLKTTLDRWAWPRL